MDPDTGGARAGTVYGIPPMAAARTGNIPPSSIGNAPNDPFLTALAARIGSSQGWRRWLLGMALGLLACGALPPFNLVPLLLIALPGLVWLLEGARNGRQAAADGWRFGFTMFTPGLYWTAISMFVDIGQFWFMVPFAVFGLPAYLACYTGLSTALAWWRPPSRRFSVSSLRGLALLAACWTAGEWLRGHLLTGFPWALAGYAWDGQSPLLLPMLQFSAILGSYGLSLITIFIMAAPASLASPLPGRAKWATSCVAAVLLLMLWGWGAARLHPTAFWLGAPIRIVQPNITQLANITPETQAADLATIIRLARRPSNVALAATVWPEGAVDYFLNRDINARHYIALATPPGGVTLTGTVRANDSGPIDRIWNSVGVVDDTGALIRVYDKNHLVPFGEYVPLRDYMPFRKIVADRFDFSTGPGPQTLDIPGLPSVSPIICYEAIFPHAVVDEAHRPGWLLNVTNDAWFGSSIGPYQHFMIARMRAIEEGLPLLRAANTGISGSVDPYGRILTTLGLGRQGVLDVNLPMALPTPPPYATWGDAPLGILLLGSAIVAHGTRKKAN